jgi:hypothetical protein
MAPQPPSTTVLRHALLCIFREPKKRTGKLDAGELRLGRRDSHSHVLQLGPSTVDRMSHMYDAVIRVPYAVLVDIWSCGYAVAGTVYGW